MNVDVVLIEQAKRGDKDSFADLYEQVADELYRVALYTLGNVHDAQDAVSETFVEAYRGLGFLRDNAAFRAWIMRILTIRCKRKMGQYVKERGQMDVDELVSLSDGEDTVEQSLSRADLLAALSKLSAQERQIVLLSAVQGYTLREIAQVMRAPQGTVSSKLCRAMKKLRGLIER